MAKSYYECIESIDAQTALIHAKFGAPEKGVEHAIELNGRLATGRLRMTPSAEEERSSFRVINFSTLDMSRSNGHFSYTVFPVREFAITQFDGLWLPKSEIRKVRQEEEAYARPLIAVGASQAPMKALTVTGLRRMVEDFDRFAEQVLS